MERLGKRAEAETLWEDPEDANVEINLSQEARLRKVMRKSGKTVVDGNEYQELMKDHVSSRTQNLRYMNWASEGTPADQEQDEEGQLDQLLKSDALAGKDALPEDILEIRKWCENGHQDKLESVVQTLHCHPRNNQVFLAGGFDKHLKIFEIGEKELNVKKTVFMKDFAIKCSRFCAGEELVVSSLAPGLRFYNLEKEKMIVLNSLFSHKGLDKKDAVIGGIEVSQKGDMVAAFTENSLGNIGVVNSQSKQMLFELNMNEGCVDAKFGREHQLITAGDRGYVYIWDLRKRAVIEKFKDFGSQTTTAITTIGDFLLTGSKAGYVNMYQSPFNQKSEPIKRFENITTTITSLKASPDGTKVVFGSKWKKNSLKIANLQQKQVYRNWPNMKTVLGMITQTEFSIDGNYLVVGNEKGRIVVYKLGELDL